MNEQDQADDRVDAVVIRGTASEEVAKVVGRYEFECIGPDGEVKWRDVIDNLVTTVGKNFILDTVLGGSAYTAAAFLGIIGAVSYTTGPAAGDTMASHGGWTEGGGANAPTYTGNRKTANGAAFNAAAAGSKALTTALSYAITGTGTVKGAFLVSGSGASATKDDTGGVLLSAGLFSGGDKPVGNGDTINASWSLGLT